MSDADRHLGMDRPIDRRDFLNGVAVAGGAMLAGSWLAGCRPEAPAPYPPALTGLRGSHPGSFEVFHSVRDGTFWPTAPAPRSTGEHYDLVVVGGGISGLAAAHFFRRARPDARVLILENHDDFGGHAKRNELSAPSRTAIGYGGTQSIDSPAPYSPVARGLIEELGIEMRRWPEVLHEDTYRSLGLGPGFFFDGERFGTDRLVHGSPEKYDPAFVEAAPLAPAVKRDLTRLYTARFDPYPRLDEAAKRARLARMSYADFLTRVWKVDPGVLPVFQTFPHDLFGVGIDAVPAQDAFGLGLPGFQGLGLDPTRGGPGQNRDTIPSKGPSGEDYYFHFPDGNASIARLLVRGLVPGAIPGGSMDDVVTARADYGRLDRRGSPVRIRLSSTAVRVRNSNGDGAGVEVAYVKDGRLATVTGGAVVLACWHATIPYLTDELPAAQVEALRYAIKVPLVYTNVLIRNWTSFVNLGVRRVATPGFWHSAVSLDFPVSLGTYHHSQHPDEPVVLHLQKAACQPGLPTRDQHRAGRQELFTTSFETIERSIRTQLGRVLGGGGFDPARDVLGITVNRWPHGYAYQYNSLADDFWLEGRETPCEVARRPFGRVAIANADAAAYAYTDAAIDEAHRAVQELLGVV